MITIEMVMLATLGFLTAALLALFIAPLYRRRIARLTTDALKRSMPLTDAEIRADKDRLRAEFAIRIHKLETRVEEAAEASARQMVELNRRDATISELEGEVAKQHTALEEHENARRVLEQTIMDRLPKVEHRLAEARKLLFQRDREIVALTQSSEKQSRALEEATQINAQQTDEVHRLKAALNTRAARNRDGLGDPRYDGEVALRTEIETLRAKTREQTALIARLQSLVARAGPAAEAGEGATTKGSGEAMRPAKVRAGQAAATEQATPPPLKPVDKGSEAADPQAQNEIRRLKSVNQDQAAELSRLKAALTTYEAADSDDRGVKESKIALKARLSALQALTDEQSGTIQALRAELAAGNEKLARQAAYFMEEMRRLGSVPAPGPSRRGPDGADGAKRPLAERINDPRVARFPRPGAEVPAQTAPADEAKSAEAEPRRGGGFLKALDAASLPVETRVEHAPPPETANGEAAPAEVKRTRKARLLDRITGLDKNSA
ncbi:MAG: hypothetical protein ACK4TP_05440 [Hyphomicrobium sp.]